MTQPGNPLANINGDRRAGMNADRRAGMNADRRAWLRGAGSSLAAALLAPLAASIPGCVTNATASRPEHVWGRRGLSEGRFLKPRAITIDADDLLYIVDTTGRIQVFDADGQYIRGWKTPETQYGRPTGLSIRGIAGQPPILLVADTHYYRMLAYDLAGHPLDEYRIGGVAGHGPGEFAFVTDAVCDSQGNFYVGEYGDSDRIQKFDPEGRFVCQWGGTGADPGSFVRPQSLVIDDSDRLWVVDACNHRIQRFDLRQTPPAHLDTFGGLGGGLGQFYYPYDLCLAKDGTAIVCEYGNQRLQRLDDAGRGVATWGGPGHGPGQLYQPWGVVTDSKGRIHVLDSNNHRVQRLGMFG
jgi:sugar lactone lactonase YvrE